MVSRLEYIRSQPLERKNGIVLANLEMTIVMSVGKRYADIEFPKLAFPRRSVSLSLPTGDIKFCSYTTEDMACDARMPGVSVPPIGSESGTPASRSSLCILSVPSSNRKWPISKEVMLCETLMSSAAMTVQNTHASRTRPMY